VLCRDASASTPVSKHPPVLVPRLHWVADDDCCLGSSGSSPALCINQLDHRALPWWRSEEGCREEEGCSNEVDHNKEVYTNEGYSHEDNRSALARLASTLEAVAKSVPSDAKRTRDDRSIKAHTLELPPNPDASQDEMKIDKDMQAAATALAELDNLVAWPIKETRPDGLGAREHIDAELPIHRVIIEQEQQEIMAHMSVFIAMSEAQASVFHEKGGTKCRQYATGQRLLVRMDGEWAEAEVVGHVMRDHLIRRAEESPRRVLLDPWNHAPLELPLAVFDALRTWYAAMLNYLHSSIVDNISGKRLDVLVQCVALTMEGTDVNDTVENVKGVHEWVIREHARLSDPTRDAQDPACLLITAGPAAGKTTLTSQLMMQMMDGPLVPILVRGQLWHKRLAERRDVFSAAWNWVDGYVQVEFEQQPAVLGMLRQAMRCRRAVLILDGLDECGSALQLFQAHISGTLVPQGHVIVALSRPAGLDEASLRAFRRASLQPLSEAQQQNVLEHRLHEEEERNKLWSYICERLPLDADGKRITSNPLMLSMLISIAELRIGHEMPRSVADLYKVGTEAMLARAKMGTENTSTSEQMGLKLGMLLRKLYVHAMWAERRVIDGDLIKTAVGEDAPWLIECIRRDRVPLLSLLQAEPLEVQAPHLSFQEFMVAQAIADGAELPVKSVEQLRPSWANVMRLGAGLGEGFCLALAERLGLSVVEALQVHLQHPANEVPCCAAVAAVLQSTRVRIKELR